MKKTNKGFTLAELMIVLGVLGVIAAVLTPVLFDAMPDENRVKFRKAVYVLQKGIEGTINGPGYETASDATLILNNGGSATATTFCTQLADQLNTVGTILCTATANPTTTNFVSTTANIATTMDGYCTKRNALSGTQNWDFRTPDGVTWWVGKDAFTARTLSGGIDTRYVTLCIDVDHDNASQLPFAFGVRADGKIFFGKRANDWMKESVKDAIDNR